jgi:hypothetical protein
MRISGRFIFVFKTQIGLKAGDKPRNEHPADSDENERYRPCKQAFKGFGGKSVHGKGNAAKTGEKE